MAINKYLLGFIILVIIIAAAVVFFSSGGMSLFSKTAKATFGDKTVSLEVADTEKAREIGLSKYHSLSDNRGMLFLFDQPGLPAFWMKGMSFPIDIIFLNSDKVVTVYKNVPAPKDKNDTNLPLYQPTAPSDKVIELKAGAADKYGIKQGQTIKLSI
jgi:uncharacterized membrane protein (UPF0127 family)